MSSTAFRPDIQGLRAVAVLLVLAYHLWPDSVTGGFVGVDVFFVISGFLITAHLLQHPPRRSRDLLEFWGRRIRRILPAAFLVLAVTAVASRIFAPDTRWAANAGEIIATLGGKYVWKLTPGTQFPESRLVQRVNQIFKSLIGFINSDLQFGLAVSALFGHSVTPLEVKIARQVFQPGIHRYRHHRVAGALKDLQRELLVTQTDRFGA